jgi:hypothetical protein
MAEKTITVYSCDRCGKEIGIHRYGSNYKNDIWNYCWYDLCDDCAELWNEYNLAMHKLSKEMDRLTEEGKWGKLMFNKENEDGNR